LDIIIRHGVSVGNKVLIRAPQAQLVRPNLTKVQELMEWNLDFIPTPTLGTGNNQFYVQIL
jgi:hypothetical protein